MTINIIHRSFEGAECLRYISKRHSPCSLCGRDIWLEECLTIFYPDGEREKLCIDCAGSAKQVN